MGSVHRNISTQQILVSLYGLGCTCVGRCVGPFLRRKLGLTIFRSLIVLTLLARVLLSQHPPSWITLLDFSFINHFFQEERQLTRELMIPSLVDNGNSQARSSARSILSYPVLLEVTCPFIPLLFAIPKAMDVGIGSSITKARLGVSFVLKIFRV